MRKLVKLHIYLKLFSLQLLTFPSLNLLIAFLTESPHKRLVMTSQKIRMMIAAGSLLMNLTMSMNYTPV